MQIAKLQLITQDLPNLSHFAQAKRALEAGVKWVQLRMKYASDIEIVATGVQLRKLCDEHDACFILNDKVNLVDSVRADGVHIGATDMEASMARMVLGEDKIIGGTANTAEEIQHLADHVNYIGLGPFMFTDTKKDLSPVLGLEGYENVLKQLELLGIKIPVVGIGSVGVDDIEALLSTGLHGVAVASAINKSEEVKKVVQGFQEKIALSN